MDGVLGAADGVDFQAQISVEHRKTGEVQKAINGLTFSNASPNRNGGLHEAVQHSEFDINFIPR